jgi:hypothetical protein
VLTDTLPSFVSICHGQPWVGNVYFRYEEDQQDGERYPMEAIFTDFHACAMGRTGQDLAHFMLASTTRQFRQDHLDQILQAYLTELEDVITCQGNLQGRFFATIFESHVNNGLLLKTDRFPTELCYGKVRKVA